MHNEYDANVALAAAQQAAYDARVEALGYVPTSMADWQKACDAYERKLRAERDALRFA